MADAEPPLRHARVRGKRYLAKHLVLLELARPQSYALASAPFIIPTP